MATPISYSSPYTGNLSRNSTTPSMNCKSSFRTCKHGICACPIYSLTSIGNYGLDLFKSQSNHAVITRRIDKEMIYNNLMLIINNLIKRVTAEMDIKFVYNSQYPTSRKLITVPFTYNLQWMDTLIEKDFAFAGTIVFAASTAKKTTQWIKFNLFNLYSDIKEVIEYTPHRLQNTQTSRHPYGAHGKPYHRRRDSMTNQYDSRIRKLITLYHRVTYHPKANIILMSYCYSKFYCYRGNPQLQSIKKIARYHINAISTDPLISLRGLQFMEPTYSKPSRG